VCETRKFDVLASLYYDESCTCVPQCKKLNRCPATTTQDIVEPSDVRPSKGLACFHHQGFHKRGSSKFATPKIRRRIAWTASLLLMAQTDCPSQRKLFNGAYLWLHDAAAFTSSHRTIHPSIFHHPPLSAAPSVAVFVTRLASSAVPQASSDVLRLSCLQQQT